MKDGRELLVYSRNEEAIKSVNFSDWLEVLDVPELCSVTELRRQAEASRHETHHRGERIFLLNAAIALPEASQMPVLTLAWAEDAPFASIRPEDLDEEEHGFGFVKNPPFLLLEQACCYRRILSRAHDWQENHFGKKAFTPKEAVAFVQSKMEHYTQGNVKIIVDSRVAVSLREPQCDGQRKPRGYYELYFKQVMRGIPILGSIANTLHYSVKEKGSGYPVPTAFILSPESYWIGTSHMVERATIHKDVPLLPFGAMVEIWEGLVAAGRIRDIESIRLGYVLYAGRENPSEIWAIPSWVMKCRYYEGSQGGLMVDALESAIGDSLESALATDDCYRTRELIFHGQTGAMAEVGCRREDGARCPEIFAVKAGG